MLRHTRVTSANLGSTEMCQQLAQRRTLTAAARTCPTADTDSILCTLADRAITAGLTIVPVVPWEAPTRRQGPPINSQIFPTLFLRLNVQCRLKCNDD